MVNYDKEREKEKGIEREEKEKEEEKEEGRTFCALISSRSATIFVILLRTCCSSLWRAVSSSPSSRFSPWSLAICGSASARCALHGRKGKNALKERKETEK